MRTETLHSGRSIPHNTRVADPWLSHTRFKRLIRTDLTGRVVLRYRGSAIHAWEECMLLSARPHRETHIKQRRIALLHVHADSRHELRQHGAILRSTGSDCARCATSPALWKRLNFWRLFFRVEGLPVFKGKTANQREIHVPNLSSHLSLPRGFFSSSEL